jgi:WD40 repeat protein
MTLMGADNPEKSLLDLPFDPIKVISINSCAFNSNSRYIAGGGNDSVVKVWETKSNNRDIHLNLKEHFGAVNSVCWGNSGNN